MEIGIIEIIEILEIVGSIKQLMDENEAENDELQLLLDTFTDGELESNDIEVLLTDINNSLALDDENSQLYEISSRLEVIDARLDSEFVAVNQCLGFLACTAICFFAFKAMSWFYRIIGV